MSRSALGPAQSLASALALVACAAPPAFKTAAPTMLQVDTTAQGAPTRLALTQTLRLDPGAPAADAQATILVNPRQRFQTLLGIGGAITDASAEVFARLPAA